MTKKRKRKMIILQNQKNLKRKRNPEGIRNDDLKNKMRNKWKTKKKNWGRNRKRNYQSTNRSN